MADSVQAFELGGGQVGGGGSSSSAGPAGQVGHNPYAFSPMSRWFSTSYSGGGAGGASETGPWTSSNRRPVNPNPTGPQVIDPEQDVRVTADDIFALRLHPLPHGVYHVVSGACSVCPKDQSKVCPLRMARDHLRLRPCRQCNVADYVSRNMIPAPH